jgi:hypothetical protein
MRCSFCTNPASDREGVPLCSPCWGRIDQQVRDKKLEPLDSMQLILQQYALACLGGGRESAIISFGSLVGRLVGPPPGTNLN